MSLDQTDEHHVNAALRLLGLGDWQSANDEIDKIPPTVKWHPMVLPVRYKIYAKAGKWNEAAEMAGALAILTPELSEVWINLANATRRKADGRISKAKEILTKARLKFPKEYLFAYNLACYECQSGNPKKAMKHLRKAIDLSSKRKIRLMALSDTDLEPLLKDIMKI